MSCISFVSSVMSMIILAGFLFSSVAGITGIGWFVVLRAVRRGISRANRDTGNTFWAKLTMIVITAMDSGIRTYTISEA